MTPAETWTWMDALETIESDDEDEDGEAFFGEWFNDLMDEITQGRALIANASFDSVVVLSSDNDPVKIYGCVFKSGGISMYPIRLG